MIIVAVRTANVEIDNNFELSGLSFVVTVQNSWISLIHTAEADREFHPSGGWCGSVFVSLEERNLWT